MAILDDIAQDEAWRQRHYGRLLKEPSKASQWAANYQKEVLIASTADSNLKHYLERQDELKYEDWFDNEMKFYDSPDLKQWTKVPKFQLKRQLRLKMPDNVKQWFKDSGHADLLPKFETYAKEQARFKDQLTKAIKNDPDLDLDNRDLEKEHWNPISGAKEEIAKRRNPKTGKRTLNPIISVTPRGSDTEGGAGSGPWNRYIGSRRAFAITALQQLNQPVNWMEAAVNFVADRPDKKTKLPGVNTGKLRNTDFLRLQQGLVTADQLEIEGFRNEDLRRSGIQNPTNYRALMGKLLNEINTKMQVKRATDRSKKFYDIKTKDRGDLSWDDKERQDAAKLPPKTKTTYLPSPATGKTKVTPGGRLGGDPVKLRNMTKTRTNPKNTLKLRSGSGFSLDTNFSDDLVKPGVSLSDIMPSRSSFYAPIPVRHGDTQGVFIYPIDKV
jgi:hypothetical protein